MIPINNFCLQKIIFSIKSWIFLFDLSLANSPSQQHNNLMCHQITKLPTVKLKNKIEKKHKREKIIKISFKNKH